MKRILNALPSVFTTVVELAGLTLVSTGFFLLNTWAGFVATGLSLLLIGKALEG